MTIASTTAAATTGMRIAKTDATTATTSSAVLTAQFPVPAVVAVTAGRTVPPYPKRLRYPLTTPTGRKRATLRASPTRWATSTTSSTSL